MATEIERKFLVKGDEYREQAQGRRYRQAYLSTDKERVVRVRVVDQEAWLTIKGRTRGVSRAEFEYPIPVEDAIDMLENLCQQPVIDKTRYRLPLGDHVWEIDEFHGVNDGLVVAEIELEDEDQPFEKPDWLGDEVSGDPRYFNANLIAHPYRDWSE
ncbi:MAG: CYTH domain-containing protein [Wenzhouxiangella sp.]|nr:MAG: CYTH domain-containing protein [Wenzhouxiangella sp.]